MWILITIGRSGLFLSCEWISKILEVDTSDIDIVSGAPSRTVPVEPKGLDLQSDCSAASSQLP